MHTQKHLHKTHPKHASYTARRQKQLANVRRLRRLCAKSALCTSVFTLTLLVSSEWTIQNPQSDHWSFAQHASSFEQDKQNPAKENTKSSKASDKQAAGHTSKSRRKASSDSKKNRRTTLLIPARSRLTAKKTRQKKLLIPARRLAARPRLQNLTRQSRSKRLEQTSVHCIRSTRIQIFLILTKKTNYSFLPMPDNRYRLSRNKRQKNSALTRRPTTPKRSTISRLR